MCIRYYEKEYYKFNDYSEHIKNFLLGKEENLKYIDLDQTYKDDSPIFYINMIDFLSCRSVQDNKWNFKLKTYIKGNAEPASIQFDFNNGTLYLRTDLFGFSVGKDFLKDNIRPFGKLRNEETGNKETYKFIGQCINDTRTIGGAFIWPIKKCGRNWMSMYNWRRGATSYIEDRVDRTLFEIKTFYDIYNKKEYINIEKEKRLKTVINDMSENFLLLRYSDKEEIANWLVQFGTFENYVDFFMFNPFVVKKDGKYYPIDIIKSYIKEKIHKEGIDIRSSNLIIIDNETFNCKKEIQTMKNMKVLKKMLNNVRLLTLDRSRMMESFLKDKQCWK